jgi:uncharacterized protein YdeI (YjbR/CyaY-like superfamily)
MVEMRRGIAVTTGRTYNNERKGVSPSRIGTLDMSAKTSGDVPTFFATAIAFRAWLAAHSGSAKELIVGFYKVGAGRASMSWPESVDEALCVGWIDGVRKRIDDVAYQIRFTPRKVGSIWSTVNIARVAALTAEGRMQPAGLAAFARRVEAKSAVYAYEQAHSAQLTTAETQVFKANKAAWAYFEQTPAGYRKTMLHWVCSAKQPATRARRLAQWIDSCAAGIRFPG